MTDGLDLQKANTKKILTKYFIRKQKENNEIIEGDELIEKNNKENEVDIEKISEEEGNLIKQGENYFTNDEELLHRIELSQMLYKKFKILSYFLQHPFDNLSSFKQQLQALYSFSPSLNKE